MVNVLEIPPEDVTTPNFFNFDNSYVAGRDVHCEGFVLSFLELLSFQQLGDLRYLDIPEEHYDLGGLEMSRTCFCW